MPLRRYNGNTASWRDVLGEEPENPYARLMPKKAKMMKGYRDIAVEVISLYFFEKFVSPMLTESGVPGSGKSFFVKWKALIQGRSPTYHNPTGKKAYIMNMYTEPEYRRQGLAFHTLDLLVKDAKKQGISQITLEATDMGRALYERYGFVKMENEMELR